MRGLPGTGPSTRVRQTYSAWYCIESTISVAAIRKFGEAQVQFQRWHGLFRQIGHNGSISKTEHHLNAAQRVAVVGFARSIGYAVRRQSND